MSILPEEIVNKILSYRADINKSLVWYQTIKNGKERKKLNKYSNFMYKMDYEILHKMQKNDECVIENIELDEILLNIFNDLEIINKVRCENKLIHVSTKKIINYYTFLDYENMYLYTVTTKSEINNTAYLYIKRMLNGKMEIDSIPMYMCIDIIDWNREENTPITEKVALLKFN